MAEEEAKQLWSQTRVKTPTVLQMEAVECGAASLGIILAYHGLWVPLEELRVACGVSRDGSKAANILKAARTYGMVAEGYRLEIQELTEIPLPTIIFWDFVHFLVLEGIVKDKVYLNDPLTGPRTISLEEMDKSYTGVALKITPGPEFQKGGSKPGVLRSLRTRMKGNESSMLLIVLASFFLVLLGLVIPTFSRIFIDQILVGNLKDWLKPLFFAMVVTALLRGAVTLLQMRYLLRLETKLAIATSMHFLLHILRMPMEFFSQRFGGDIAARVQLNDKVAKLLGSELTPNVLNVVMIAFYAVLMFQYDLLLTFVGVSSAVLQILLLQMVSRKRANMNMRLQQEHGKLIGVSMNGLQLIETLKASGSESDFFSQWAGQQTKVVNAQQSFSTTSQMLSIAPMLLTTLNTTAILILGGFRVMGGHLTMGMLVAFQSLMACFMDPVKQMVNLGTRFQEAQADMMRLDDVMKYRPDPLLAPKAEGDSAETAAVAATLGNRSKLSGRIELRNVTFGYSRLAKPLIENFNLTLQPGSRVALVGGSGSGKSTVSKLVAGLYQPWSGEILFDGLPIGSIPRRLFCNSVAMVDQDIVLFEGSVKDNLTMWDSTIPEADMIQAAKDACIHGDIAARAGGYSAFTEEGGNNFSGGQRQRIEIARALAGNPAILIMDEATSALDATTEMLVDENLRRRGCTCLIVAHRLSTIRDCDEIVVLDGGKVVERGTHEELVKNEGCYLELIKAT